MSEKIRLMATGDVAAIRGFEHHFLTAPLDRVIDPRITALLHDADLAVANIECVLTDSEDFAVPGYALRCSPALAPLFRQMGIDLATLANNHIRDVRDQGVIDTIHHLQQAGINTCGAGKNTTEAARFFITERRGICLGIMAVAEREYNIATEAEAGAALFEPLTWEKDIRALREQCDVAIVCVHAGHEFASLPSPRIRKAYQAAIDFGAHAVIGHHPHVLQGVETYKDCPIFYSLGNFCFDSAYVSAYEGWDDGILLELQISAAGVEDYFFHPLEIRRDHSVWQPDEKCATAIMIELKQRCDLLGDDAAYQEAWQRFVRWRCEKNYLQKLNDLPTRLQQPDGPTIARGLKNYFQCPTHVELLMEYFDCFVK